MRDMRDMRENRDDHRRDDLPNVTMQQIFGIKPTVEEELQCYVMGHDYLFVTENEDTSIYACTRCGIFEHKDKKTTYRREQ